jgi:hypothetical protein
VAELQTILLEPYPCGTDPCIDQTIFGPTEPSWYWSSTTASGSSADAWTVYFSDGWLDDGPKTASTFVRAVRSGL